MGQPIRLAHFVFYSATSLSVSRHGEADPQQAAGDNRRVDELPILKTNLNNVTLTCYQLHCSNDMRSRLLVLIAVSLFAGAALASPTVPKEGVEFTTLSRPQPVASTGKKIEVTEFFMYHCPHCNAFEPFLEQWVKKQGDKIVFRRIHMPYRGANDPEAHLFLTLEALGKSEEMQAKVFKAVHVDRIRLTQDDAIIDWVGKNGIDRKKFLDAWNSFGVMTKLRRLPQVMDNYKVQFVPTLVIDGKYQTMPSMAQTAIQATSEPQIFGATLQIMDALVAKASATK